MKKLCILAVAMFLTIGSFAQNMNVQTAFSSHKKGKLAEALEAIQPALENAQTVGQAKTWFYYGNICYDIANSQDANYANLLPDPMSEAMRGYTKAKELDKRNEYTENIDRMMGGIAGYYAEKGYTKFEEQAYNEAADNFMKAYSMGRKEELENAGRAYLAAENWTEAEKIFLQLKNTNVDDPIIYVALTKIAVSQKDMNKALSYLNEAEKKFPDNEALLTEKVNLYLTTELGDKDKDTAPNTLKKLISLNPTNAVLYYNLGVCYSKDTTKFAETEQAYKKCIELDPSYTNGYVNLSNLYIEKSNGYVTEARKLPLNAEKEYNDLVEKSNVLLKQALPFMEKAYSLDKTDPAIKAMLKEVYIKLDIKDKAGAMTN